MRNWLPIIQFGEFWCFWLRSPWGRIGILGNKPNWCEPLFSERNGYCIVWRCR